MNFVFSCSQWREKRGMIVQGGAVPVAMAAGGPLAPTSHLHPSQPHTQSPSTELVRAHGGPTTYEHVTSTKHAVPLQNAHSHVLSRQAGSEGLPRVRSLSHWCFPLLAPSLPSGSFFFELKLAHPSEGWVPPLGTADVSILWPWIIKNNDQVSFPWLRVTQKVVSNLLY